MNFPPHKTTINIDNSDLNTINEPIDFDMDNLKLLEWKPPPIASKDFAIKETDKFYNNLKAVQKITKGSFLDKLKGKTIKEIKQVYEKGRSNIELSVSPSHQCWSIQKTYTINGLQNFYKGIINIKDPTNTMNLISANHTNINNIIISDKLSDTGSTGAHFKNDGDVCWLCSGLISMNGGQARKDVCFKGSQCEHILPAGTIQTFFVLPIEKYNKNIKRSLTALNINSEKDIMDYIILRTTLLQSVFDWAHPYCNQIKKDYPLIMPVLNTNKDLELQLESNNIKKLSYEIMEAKNMPGAPPTDGCNGNGYKDEWYGGPATNDEETTSDIFEIYKLITYRCNKIIELFNKQEKGKIWNCVKISILTTQKQIKDRLRSKWLPKSKFLVSIFNRINKIKVLMKGGDPKYMTSKKIRQNESRNDRSIDRSIVDVFENYNLINEIIHENFNNDIDKFTEFINLLSETIETLTIKIDQIDQRFKFKG